MNEKAIEEAAARALYDWDASRSYDECPSWDHESTRERTKERYRARAHAVLAALPEYPKPGDIVEIEVPARSSTSKDGLRYRGILVAKDEESEREVPAPSRRKVR